MSKSQGWIYKIENKANGKIYVGQTIQSPKVRWQDGHRNHLRKKKHYNDHLQAAWNKYGEDSFTFEVIEQFDPGMNFDLNNLEKYWVRFHDSMNPEKGYNQTEGGNSGRRSEATKKKLSEIRKQYNKDNPGWNSGERHPLYGKRGENSPNFGRKASALTKERASEARKGKGNFKLIGRPRTEETKTKIRDAALEQFKTKGHPSQGRPSKRRKAVLCLNNNIIYESTVQASKELGVASPHISMICNGKMRQAKGFKFQYHTETKEVA